MLIDDDDDADPLTQPSATPVGPGSVELRGVVVTVEGGTPVAQRDAVLGSLRWTPGAADTTIAGACPLQRAAVRLVPTPLTAPLVLDRGGVTLAPPQPGDAPVVAAPTSRPGERRWTTQTESLYLARFSSALPAMVGPGGKAMPVNVGVLSWVIVTAPVEGRQDCGLWGIDATNARTGASNASSGWSPGP